MKTLFYKLTAWMSVLTLLLPIAPVFAANPFSTAQTRLEGVGTAAGLGGTSSLPSVVGRLIAVLLGALGIIFVILVIIAGISYMTAAGDTDKVKKAKALLTQAIIGMVIILAAYSISSFVISQLTGVTTTTTSGTSSGSTP